MQQISSVPLFCFLSQNKSKSDEKSWSQDIIHISNFFSSFTYKGLIFTICLSYKGIVIFWNSGVASLKALVIFIQDSKEQS